jgi:predicted Holliday junction resolvase-like endonuclease
MEKYNAADARFIGNPVDFIVFKNLHTWSPNSGSEPQPVEVAFVEVKTNSSGLNRNERAVRDAVSNLRVKYDLLKISLDDKVVSASAPASDTETQ